MHQEEPSTARPFVFTVIKDDGVNVTIEARMRLSHEFCLTLAGRGALSLIERLMRGLT